MKVERLRGKEDSLTSMEKHSCNPGTQEAEAEK